MTQTANDPRLAFRFAPCINHESVAKMSPAQQEQALHELIDLRDAVKRHVYSPKASPQTRLVALDLLLESAWRTRGRKEKPPLMEQITDPMPVHYPTVSDRLGIHRNSVGKEYKALRKVGLLRMSTRTDEDGKEHVDVAINPGLSTHADRLPTKGERPRTAPQFKSPGIGKHCSECGSGNVDIICRECGNVEQLGDFPHDVEEETVFPSAPPAVNETLSTREVLSIDGIQNCTREVLSGNPQEQAARLLLAIAGDTPTHIEMSKTSESTKYFEVPDPLTFDNMLDHLSGVVTKGIKGRSDEGKTRALCKDADNPEEQQLLQEAARLLAIMEFKPILIPSPVKTGKHAGGGHLWIIFDGLVDAYSAWQTVYQYAPMLRDIKEYWPGGGINIRLPGGKYVRPGFEAECHLFDEHMQNGIGTAAMLLTRQTPVSVVNEYCRPEPTPEPVRTKPAPGQGGYLEKDLAKQAIVDFNASHSWGEILGESNRSGKYLASWRGDRTPNVAVDPQTDLAKDFARLDEPSMDKYDAWCHVQGGQNWQSFKKLDLARRCREYRERLAAIPATRFTEQPCRKCGGHDLLQREDGLWLCSCYFPIVQQEIAS